MWLTTRPNQQANSLLLLQQSQTLPIKTNRLTARKPIHPHPNLHQFPLPPCASKGDKESKRTLGKINDIVHSNDVLIDLFVLGSWWVLLGCRRERVDPRRPFWWGRAWRRRGVKMRKRRNGRVGCREGEFLEVVCNWLNFQEMYGNILHSYEGMSWSCWARRNTTRTPWLDMSI